MKHCHKILMFTLSAAAMLVCEGAIAQTVLKLGHAQTVTSAFQVGAVAFADEVAKQSKGRLKIDVVPNGELGGEKDLVEKVKGGQLDLALTSSGPVGAFVPEVMITDVPFLFRDYDHARKVMDGPIGKSLLDQCESKGLVGLAWGENGFRHLTNNKSSVKEPSDLQGLKIRTMENPIHMTAFRSLGAFPVPMPFTQLYGALEAKTVDGEENPLAVIVSSNFGKVQKYLTLTGHVYSPALFVASPASLAKLTPADRMLVTAAAKSAALTMRKKVSELETGGVAELKSQGMEVVTTYDKPAFVAALKGAYAQYEKRFGAENIEKIRDVK